MRVLYFSRDYGNPTTTFIRNEVEFFTTKFDCIYLCQKAWANDSRREFVKVVPFGNAIESRWKWFLWKTGLNCQFYSRKYSAAIRKIIDDFKPDIIHCHFVMEALMLIDNIDYKKYRIILHFHGYDASQSVRKRSYRKRLRDLLKQPGIYPISCNQYFGEQLSSLLTIPLEKFFILHYGIDTDFFINQTLNKTSDTRIFVQVSSLVEKKGHAYTLIAFSQLLKKMGSDSCRLIIAGDGPCKNKLQKMVKQLGIDNHVIFRGTVSPDQVVHLLEEADVFVHHSVTASNGDMEGMPNALIEAMAMELPVVSTYHSGIPELVEDGVNGFLVRERDVEEYTIKMQEALKLGRLKNNRTKIRDFYDQKMHNARLESFYDTIFISGDVI